MTDPNHRFTIPELLELMKANKVLHLKMGTMELTLDPSAFAAVTSATDMGTVNATTAGQEPSPMELLFWSADGAFEEPKQGSN